MLKKLTTLSLSLLLCASVLPAQAGAMDASEDVLPVQSEEYENPDEGIAPCAGCPQDQGGSGGHVWIPDGNWLIDAGGRPYLNWGN